MLSLLLILLLFSNSLNNISEKSILYSRIAIKSLVYTSVLAYSNLYIKALQDGVSLFGGLFNVTVFTQAFNIFILVISAIILVLTAFFPRKVYLKEHSSIYKLLSGVLTYNKKAISNKGGEQFRIPEYALIIIFVLMGGIFLISTADLISIFLSIELQSYGLYILCTLYRNSESATASGLTYFLLGGLSSCFILLGSALIYANSGTTSLENFYVINSMSEIYNLSNSADLYQGDYIKISLIIMFVGFLFKVSAAPFHFWSPRVYDGIPTIVTTYVAIVAKISIFAFFLELAYYTDYSSDNTWKNIFVLSSFFSLIIGSILGLTQSGVKSLFAYCTISHVGFILLALSINSTESIQSYIFYILQYTISNLNAFVILISIGFSLYLYTRDEDSKERLIDNNNSPVQLISQMKGYFYINSYLAISLTITLFSFMGIPPIVGFFGKQMILSAALDNGNVFMSFIAILTSVIGAAYYLNFIKEIFFHKTDYKLNGDINKVELTGYSIDNSTNVNTEKVRKGIVFTSDNITINSGLSVTISFTTLLLILFIFMPGDWLNLVNILSLTIFNT